MNKISSGRRDTRRPPGQAGATATQADRRHGDPTTDERELAPEVREFARAVDDYKRASGRMFPTWSEVLEVLTGLGYRKRP
jgi:hypothetical protein